MGEDALRKALYAAMDAADIDRKGPAFPAHGGFTLHDLRHTFGSLAVQTWPLHDVQAYMGHEDIKTTMIYVHHIPKVGAAQEFTEFIRRKKDGISGIRLGYVQTETPEPGSANDSIAGVSHQGR